MECNISLAFPAEIRQAEKKGKARTKKINEIKNQKTRGSSPISEKSIHARVSRSRGTRELRIA